MVISLDIRELDFINKNECCRLSTSFNDEPHVVPVCYIFIQGKFYISTDYNTKKYKNVKSNPYACLVIDVYRPGQHTGFIVFGKAKIIEGGNKYSEIYSKFFKKFEWVRKNPWEEGEAPFIEITPTSKNGWGL
jgi:nitroimidazol reductase NimA-like FMN-containing flavoprotein (pyridoxamine 5'-phosphate oxidase superfamily)